MVSQEGYLEKNKEEPARMPRRTTLGRTPTRGGNPDGAPDGDGDRNNGGNNNGNDGGNNNGNNNNNNQGNNQEDEGMRAMMNLIGEFHQQGEPRERNITQCPKYSGYENEDPTEWVKKFDKAAKANKWKKEDQLSIVASLLNGPAAQWYDKEEGNLAYWRRNGSLRNIANKIIERFTTISMRNKWQIEYRSIRQNPNETVSQYSARFRKTAEKAGLKALLSLYMVIMDYIAGLEARWSPMMNAVKPQTLEEAEDIARNIESATTINRTNQTNETAILMARINQLEERLEKPEDRRPQGSAAQKKWTNSWSESQHQN